MQKAPFILSLLIGLSALVVVAVVAWCGWAGWLGDVPTLETPTRPSARHIAVVGAGRDHPLWPVIHGTGIKTSLDAEDAKQFRITIDAPPMTSIYGQKKLIQELVSQGADALCVQVVDGPAIRRELEVMRDSGVTVITMFNKVESAVPFQHAGWDDIEVGDLLVHQILERFPKGAELCLLTDARASAARASVRANPGETTDGKPFTTLQERIFRTRVRKYAAIDILQEIPCATPADAIKAMRASRKSLPILDGWIALEPTPLLADADAYTEAAGDLWLISVQPLPDTWPALEHAENAVLIGGDYGAVTPLAIKMARATLRGSLDLGTKAQPVGLQTVHGGRELQNFRIQWDEWVSPARNLDLLAESEGE